MQRRGHSLGTFGHLRRISGILGNRWKHSVVFVTKSLKFGRTEVSIPPIDAKFQDLSIQRVVKGWFLILGGDKSIFHPFFVCFLKKKRGFRHEIGQEEVS